MRELERTFSRTELDERARSGRLAVERLSREHRQPIVLEIGRNGRLWDRLVARMRRAQESGSAG